MSSYSADVDLWLGCPQSDIYNEYPGNSFTDPKRSVKLSWLVATCVSISDDWARTRDLPRPYPAP